MSCDCKCFLRLFLTALWVGLQCMIAVFPDHTLLHGIVIMHGVISPKDSSSCDKIGVFICCTLKLCTFSDA